LLLARLRLCLRVGLRCRIRGVGNRRKRSECVGIGLEVCVGLCGGNGCSAFARDIKRLRVIDFKDFSRVDAALQFRIARRKFLYLRGGGRCNCLIVGRCRRHNRANIVIRISVLLVYCVECFDHRAAVLFAHVDERISAVCVCAPAVALEQVAKGIQEGQRARVLGFARFQIFQQPVLDFHIVALEVRLAHGGLLRVVVRPVPLLNGFSGLLHDERSRRICCRRFALRRNCVLPCDARIFRIGLLLQISNLLGKHRRCLVNPANQSCHIAGFDRVLHLRIQGIRVKPRSGLHSP